MNRDRRRPRILLVALVLLALTLVTVDLRGGTDSPLRGWRTAAGSVLGPLERVASAVASPVVTLVDRVQGLSASEERIAALEQENQQLRLELRTSGAARDRVEQLDAMLRVAGAGQYRVVPAQIVGFGASQGFARTVTIDAGTIDGVEPDMTVINGDGLVGRVRFASATTATVVLLVDPTANVGVRMEGSLQAGLLRGRGDEPPLLELFDPQARLGEGDRLVTFGSRDAAPFVAGVPVGEVVEVRSTPGARTRTAAVVPYVDLQALDIVGVVVEPPRTDPRDAVLPPRPAPAEPSGPAEPAEPSVPAEPSGPAEQSDPAQPAEPAPSP